MFFPGLFSRDTKHDKQGQGAGWFSNALLNSAPASKAGVHVTPESAIGFIAVYSCVRLLSESVAQLPCTLYRHTDQKGGREKASDHSLFDKLRHAPNGWMTGFDYHEYQQSGLGLRGNAYSFVERDSAGQVENIIPLNPAMVSVKIGADRKPVYDLLDEGETAVPFSKIHHIAAFKTNPYVGMSPIQAGREGIGLSLATEHHASNVFSNGTNIRGVLERDFMQGIRPLEKPQVDELKKQWRELYGGLHGDDVAVLQDGFKFKSVSMSNQDAQLLASRAHGINEVARLYNVPPHMIQQLDKATFSNIEHQQLQFVMYSLMPWIKRHEAAMMRDLLTEDERKNYYIEFNVSSLLRGDTAARFEAYAKGRQWGWLSANDVRRMENLPPIAGGDEYLTPLNMIDASQHESKAVKQELSAVRSESEQNGD